MAKRPGVTKKVSLSVREDDLRLLKRRADRVYGGNVSAVFAELIARVRREEALRKAFAWYGKAIVLTDEDRARIDEEIFGDAAPRRRRKRAL
jgi:hypothetical protein